MPKALITGVGGFTGRYLAKELHQAGYEVHGLSHLEETQTIEGVESVHACNICDLDGLSTIVADIKPDVVAHLAAIAFVAYGDVEAIYRTNVVGTRNLLEALSRSGLSLQTVLLASSANVYGNAAGVLDEFTLPAPANDYAVSKLAMEYVARLYAERLPIIVVRPFNYTGIGQGVNFLLPKIVDHVRRGAAIIELGNLDVARDFSDVRTVVQYYRKMLQTPEIIGQTINVCSGKAHTLQQVLDMSRNVSGRDFEVRVNPAFVRANEVKQLIGNRARLQAAVGTVQDIPLEETLRWMIEAPM